MRAMMVFRQLMAVLDRKLGEETRKEGLTPQDVLLFAWMEQQQGISGSTLARVTGRERQNIQVSLERLVKRELVHKYESCYRDRTVGWGLTDRGAELWTRLSGALYSQDGMLERHGVTLTFLDKMEELVSTLRKSPPSEYGPGLVDIPEEDDEVAEWDLQEAGGTWPSPQHVMTHDRSVMVQYATWRGTRPPGS